MDWLLILIRRIKIISVLVFLIVFSNYAEKVQNILFISVDDLKPSIGCFGDKKSITPYIDKLAKSGTVFLNAYCQQAVCGPSRQV